MTELPQRHWFQSIQRKALLLAIVIMLAFYVSVEWGQIAVAVAVVACVGYLGFRVARHYKFQYRLRTLLLFTLAFSIPCSWLAVKLEKARKQRRAVDAIAEMGGSVKHGWQGTRLPHFLQQLLGDDLFLPVVTVDLSRSKVTDAGLECLRDLPEVRALHLDGTCITDAGLEQVRALTQLDSLELNDVPVTDSGLENLEYLSQLRWLKLNNTRVTDLGLKHLQGMKQLQVLELAGTPITDAGLEYLKGLTNLEDLCLANTRVAGPGLTHLKELCVLQCLSLDHTPITDARLKHIKQLSQLRSLCLGNTQITDEGLEYLQGSNIEGIELQNTRVTEQGVTRLLHTLPPGRGTIRHSPFPQGKPDDAAAKAAP
jgi:hypothetical protein